MKIYVISDTHIPNRVESISKNFLEKAKDADLILHAGDLVDLSVKEELEKIAPVKAVWGNMDPLVVKDALKQKEIIKIEGVTIGLTHGRGHPAGLVKGLKEEFKDDGVDIIVFGHSHRPENRKIEKILFFNPGSLSDTVFSEYTSYGIIEIEKNKYKAEIIKL